MVPLGGLTLRRDGSPCRPPCRPLPVSSAGVVNPSRASRDRAAPHTLGIVERHRITRLIVAGILPLTLFACDSSPGGKSLDQLLPSSPGDGLPATLVTQQQLDVSAASQATPLSAGSVQNFLAGTNFQGAYSRVWGASQTYATTLAMQFATPSQATRFLTFERTGIAEGANTFVTDHPAIPGSFVFVLDGTSAVAGSAPQYCNGVWFTQAQDAFESLVCGSSPEWATQAEALANSEYALAKQALSS